MTRHGFPLVRIGAAVTLNDAEQRLAAYLAQQRHKACRDSDAPNGRRNPAGDEVTDLAGIAAEIAFGRLHNTYPDLVIGQRPEDDAQLPGGWRVDIKVTAYRTGRLLVLPNKETDMRIDLFALMVGAFPGPFELRGFMHRAEIIVPERITDLGHGATYAAEQHELSDFATLWARYSLNRGLAQVVTRAHVADALIGQETRA